MIEKILPDLSERMKATILQHAETANAAAKFELDPTETLVDLSQRVQALVGDRQLRIVCDSYYPLFAFDDDPDWQTASVRSEAVAQFTPDGDVYPHGVFRGFVDENTFRFGDEPNVSPENNRAYMVLHEQLDDTLYLVACQTVDSIEAARYAVY